MAAAIGAVLISSYLSIKLGSRSYRLQWRKDMRWEVRFSSGEKRTGKMLSGTSSNPFFVILSLRTGRHQKDTILIPKDSIDADDFILLRSRLRIEAKTAITAEE